jgi:predicted MFS family arabinose efflux permease
MPRYLIWLTLGAFALGTGGSMIVGILPLIAGDLSISVPLAGQLVTAFALAYALGAPMITVATGRLERKNMLLASICAFGLANVLAASSHSYTALLSSQIFLGLAAGTFFPTASGYAAMAVAPARHGRALAQIYSGLTIATIIGVPFGTAVGNRLGWRATFTGVAVLSAVALLGIAAGLPRVASPLAPRLRDRLKVAARPDILSVLVATILGYAAYNVVYPYLSPLLTKTAGLQGDGIALVLFIYGLSAAAGNFLGGYGADKWNARRYLLAVLAILIAVFSGFSFLATQPLAPEIGRPATIVLVIILGVAGWMFPVTQQFRLVRLAGPHAPVALSLNSSGTYLGTSLGAFLGSVALASGSVAALGWTGAACMALCFAWLALGRDAKPQETVQAQPAQ